MPSFHRDLSPFACTWTPSSEFQQPKPLLRRPLDTAAPPHLPTRLLLVFIVQVLLPTGSSRSPPDHTSFGASPAAEPYIMGPLEHIVMGGRHGYVDVDEAEMVQSVKTIFAMANKW
ncbi:hypothetical protein B0H19DRAFT_1370663 [Mycena capillaripes]|nr:hypothetical protein B0H19DRAFT_1370663 [Mycena capillaripes]